MFPSSLVLKKIGVWFEMRFGNLLDGGYYDKVIWMCSRDLLTRCCENVTPRRGGDIPQQRFWAFYLGLTRDVIETR